jgi:hypothetical protein
VECGAGGESVFAVVGCAVYGGDFTRLDVQVVDVVPLELQRLVVFVDTDGEPDVAGFPERDRVPLVAEVEVRGLFRAVDA